MTYETAEVSLLKLERDRLRAALQDVAKGDDRAAEIAQKALAGEDWTVAEPVPETPPKGWDVYRDEDGNPVTLTEAQVRAVWQAIAVVERVREHERHHSLWDHPRADLYKSRLLGRLLLDGRPPTRDKPPLVLGGPAWWGLPGGDPYDDGPSKVVI